MADDFSNSTSTTGRVTLSSTTGGTIDVANYVDWFKVSLVAGRKFEFNVSEGLCFSAGTGLAIGLLDYSGVAVAGSR